MIWRGLGKRPGIWYVPLFLVAVAVIFGFAATFGTANFFQRTLGTPFDSLGISFLHGRADIPDGAVIYESIRREGKNYIYFGAFPALLRIPWLVIFPDTFGKLAPLLGWLGGLFSAAAVLFLFREVCARSGKAFGPGTAAFLALVFSVGGPVLYLVAVPTIYQEAILWALGFSWWAIAIGYRAMHRGWSSGALFLMSVCVSGALLSRLTFALPLLGMLAGAVWLACGRRTADAPRVPLRGLALAAVPLVIAGAFTLWYNHARFGSPLTFLTWEGYELESAEVAQKRAALGSFNARRIPFSLGEYLGVHQQYLTGSFPFLSPWSPARPERAKLYFSDSAEAMISMAMASPLLIVLSVLGAVSLCLRRPPILCGVALLFLGQVFLICSWYFITYRYTAEFLPLMVVLTIAALEDPIFRARRMLHLSLLIVGVLSLQATAISTARLITYQTGIPESYRQELIQTIGRGR